jgi:hypothetical protein
VTVEGGRQAGVILGRDGGMGIGMGLPAGLRGYEGVPSALALHVVGRAAEQFGYFIMAGVEGEVQQ